MKRMKKEKKAKKTMQRNTNNRSLGKIYSFFTLHINSSKDRKEKEDRK